MLIMFEYAIYLELHRDRPLGIFAHFARFDPGPYFLGFTYSYGLHEHINDCLYYYTCILILRACL